MLTICGCSDDKSLPLPTPPQPQKQVTIKEPVKASTVTEPELINRPTQTTPAPTITVAPIPHKPLDLTIPKEYLSGDSAHTDTAHHSELLQNTLFDKWQGSVKKNDDFNISGRLFFEVDEEDYLNSKIEGGKINIEIKTD